jgi:hypothetical protein
MKNIVFLIICLSGLFSYGQIKSEIEERLSNIYDFALTESKSYNWLDHLSNDIGGRLSGSLNAERAVLWVKEELEGLGLDSVWLQPVMVPKWVRGTYEYAKYRVKPGEHN